MLVLKEHSNVDGEHAFSEFCDDAGQFRVLLLSNDVLFLGPHGLDGGFHEGWEAEVAYGCVR